MLNEGERCVTFWAAKGGKTNILMRGCFSPNQIFKTKYVSHIGGFSYFRGLSPNLFLMGQNLFDAK